MKSCLLGAVCTALLTTIPFNTVHAIPVHWTIDFAQFDDGGILTGSFVYDANINEYSSIDITTTDGTILQGYEWTDDDNTVSGSNSFEFRLVTQDSPPLHRGTAVVGSWILTEPR